MRWQTMLGLTRKAPVSMSHWLVMLLPGRLTLRLEVGLSC